MTESQALLEHLNDLLERASRDVLNAKGEAQAQRAKGYLNAIQECIELTEDEAEVV